MFGSMNNFGGGSNGGDANSGDGGGQLNSMFNMLGSNPSMLTGLMQMMNGNSNTNNTNQNPPVGKTTFVNNAVKNNQNINSELYHIIKNADSML